jgi:hypothetical protein
MYISNYSQWGLQLIFGMHNSDPTRQRVKTKILSASERDVQVLNNFKVYFK